MPKRIMNEKIYSSTRTGRPKIRWTDNVEQDLMVKEWREKAKAHPELWC